MKMEKKWRKSCLKFNLKKDFLRNLLEKNED